MFKKTGTKTKIMSQFQVIPAKRASSPLKICISGISGLGKSYSALLMAYGITKDWEKIVVIDSENASCTAYSDLGPFNYIPLDAPYSPERYIDAIQTAVDFGAECIVVDSASHEWDGSGGLVEIVDQYGAKNQPWAKATPRHRAFTDALLYCPVHLITTLRKKAEYTYEKNENGKTQPLKVGLKDIQRDGFEYDFTVYLEMTGETPGYVSVSKDRTQLFDYDIPFLVTEQLGATLHNWYKSGTSPLDIAKDRIASADLALLTVIYNEYTYYHHNEEFIAALSGRKAQLKTA